MGWSYGFWKGGFYPKELSSKDFLTYYSKYLTSVEVDSTFYRIPKAETVKEWKKKTTNSFKFSLKFPGSITHLKMLKNCQEETTVFLDRASLLEEKLGVLLLQFPPTFAKQRLPLLSEYLERLPQHFHYAVEVRNKSLLSEETFSLLKDYNVALAWVDSEKYPLTTELLANFIYLRWEGDRKKVTGTLGKIENDKTSSIKEWTKKLKTELGDREIYGYFSKYYSGLPTSDAMELLKQMQ